MNTATTKGRVTPNTMILPLGRPGGSPLVVFAWGGLVGEAKAEGLGRVCVVGVDYALWLPVKAK